MANSSIVTKGKNKIIKELIKDKDIVQAIDSSTIDKKTPENLLYTHIFDFHQNPYTINSVITFLTVQVQIPTVYNASGIFVRPTVEIYIISHERHMRVTNIPKVTANRNDYLAELIDRKLNGKTGFGIGKLVLTSNTEGSFQQDYLYRRLVFTGTDINDSMCEEE